MSVKALLDMTRNICGATYTVWAGCLVVTGRGVWSLMVSVAFLSEGLLCGGSLWKGLVPGWMRLRVPCSRMYTCSGATSSQRGPWKPERHTQVCGRLQEPRFWQGGWQSAGEREHRGGSCSQQRRLAHMAPWMKEQEEKWLILISARWLIVNQFNKKAFYLTFEAFWCFPFC